ncbi:E3 ubiquitin/ISG15 ligase TRIM25-like [Engraulis encrasicolus]|uniref:E3 ubiquitin/ISG15 ligase TRIM25-like n=1 Tax=Engraulis encrasicolus TaxID=184585 RepID=UPI002FCF15D6
MSRQGLRLEEDSFSCSVCSELLKDPVAIPCGHNFCMKCINGWWDQEDRKRTYSCPLCKHTFDSRPALHKNPLIADMVEMFRKTNIQAAAPARCYAGPGDVACDICSGRKLKAVKSCLECLKSYCATHLNAHNELVDRNHTITDATGQLQERICSRHKKVFEIFCRTDQSCICLMCTMDDHKGHDTITAKAEWSHKKEGLGQSQRRWQQIIQLKEKELQELRKAMETLKSGAQTAVKESERMFTEMIFSIEKRCSEVTELIRAQEKAEVSRAEALLKQLEQEIAELKRTDAEMNQLSQTQDPIHFLKNIVSIAGDPCSALTRRTFSQSNFFEPLKKSVSALQMQLEDKFEAVFKREIVKISAAATTAQIITHPDPGLPVRRAERTEPKLPPHNTDPGLRGAERTEPKLSPHTLAPGPWAVSLITVDGRYLSTFNSSGHRVCTSVKKSFKMASVSSQELESFSCPVCLELLRDPVTIPCGHNFCMRCIKSCWDQEDWKRKYSCPLCKHSFDSRPVLHKNPLIAEMVEKFRKTSIQAAVPARCYAGPGDVVCDVCTGRKLKAVKSCLECLKSYCATHLKAHNELVDKNHNMIEATGQLQERICPCHKKVFEIFCRTDQSCICYLCTMDDHKGHDTITARAEWSHKKEGLGQSQRRCQQIIQLKEKELQELRKAVETLKSGAQTAVEASERMFAELIRSIERRRSEVTELIRAQEKAEVNRAEGLLKLLEQEIADLKRTDAEMKQLSLTTDPIHFLKVGQTLCILPYSTVSTSVTCSKSFSLEPLKKSVSALKMELEEKLQSVFKEEIVKISAAVSDGQAPTAEPVTREDFLKYSCHFTLDPNTAHRYLHLSEGNRRVESRPIAQSYPDHPDRFYRYFQVLCREGVSARCYWEVERSGDNVAIAVSYKSVSRNGNECRFGYKDQSWSLHLSSSSSSFRHNNKQTELPLVASSRIGVYVDHRAGTLAFYSIRGDTMTLLHRVHTTFTHTLYPGFWFQCFESSVKLL